MTTVEQDAVVPLRPPAPKQSHHTPAEISQDALVELVRRLRDQAAQTGRRLPGRPALAEHIGVTTYRIRRALEEIMRDQQTSRAGSQRPPADSHTSLNGVSITRPAVAPTSQTPHTPPAPSVDRNAPHHGQFTGDAAGATPEPPAPYPAPSHLAPIGDTSAARRSTDPEGAGSASRLSGVRRAPAGAAGFYIVAAMSLLVSMDTSWHFFGDNLQITDLRERFVMFTVLEVALIACGWGMRANVRRTGGPGAPRLFAWLLCSMSGYMALQLSGLADGIARVALGPALGLVMLHLALGIEIRAHHPRNTTWARVRREFRERLLSRLGLSDDERDALARTRDRAARRVARLSLGSSVWFRRARVARALRASNVAHDPIARARMLAELAATQHAHDLATLSQPSPWLPATAEEPVM